MLKFSLTIFLLLISLFTKSQTLGGYTIYDHLATAINPYGCSSGYVTHFPDDSIWVNFNINDSITGNFSRSSINASGDDLLLETGFNRCEYSVQLLLSNGQYSASHHVATSDWISLSGIAWQFVYTNCTGGGSGASNHFMATLDFIQDFGLASSDTVTGIKIIFTYPQGDADFAGAYIISPQQVGLNELLPKRELTFYPNPFSDKLNIFVSNNSPSEITLFDITFRKLVTKTFTNLVSLNTSDLKKGIYFFEIIGNGRIIEKGKAIKE